MPRDSRLRHALAAVLVALLPLIAGVASWLAAEVEGRKREAKAWGEYGAYVTSQLYRDEALARSLERCRLLEAWARGTRAVEPQAQADAALDEIARRNGWRP